MAYHVVLSSLTGRAVGPRLLILPCCDTVNVTIINTRHLPLSCSGPNHDRDTFPKPHSGTPEFRAIRTRDCNSVTVSGTFVQRGSNSMPSIIETTPHTCRVRACADSTASALIVPRSYANASTKLFVSFVFSFFLTFNKSLKIPISAGACMSPGVSCSVGRGSHVHFILDVAFV